MLKQLFSYFIGSFTFKVSKESLLLAVNLLRENVISVKRAHTDDEGNYLFTVSAPCRGRVCAMFDLHEVVYSISPLKGFPRTLVFLRRRPGLLIGMIMLLVISYYSSRIVWGFDVVGNTSVPDDEILLLLDDLGCGYGDYIPDMDLDLIHAKFLALNKNISWIAVNLKGNFATVEVIETRKGETPSRPDGVYANLVAAEDAQIYLVKTESGASAVEPGRVVKKGEILISGVIDVREDRVRYEYAQGEVLAYVPRVIEVKVPFERAEKVYTGEKISYNSIKIFKKSINLFSKGGIEYAVYDKIIDERQICLFGVFPLPLWSSSVTLREYEYVTAKQSLEESAALAASQLKDQLDEVLESAELISNKVTYEITEEAFVIRYNMLCLTDIAKISEFTVEQ